MGLTADLAATRLHVLPVAVPGRPLLHLRLRAAVRARGWVLAATPADADLLVVCGAPEGELAAAVEHVWAQVPVPRARRRLDDADGIDEALGSAVRVLGDTVAQREAARRQAPPEPAADGDDMAGPAGIPLAEGWEGDRDGLEMDVLRLRLGPVLPDWPAGLVVDAVLSGDVVVEASARLLPGAEPEEGDPFAEACERAAQLLRLAGWTHPALVLERAIDRALAGAPAAEGALAVRRVAARVSRSALLRWSLRGMRVDVRARLLVILGDAERAALGEPPVDAPLDADALAGSLTGRGLAEARLLVAAAGPLDVSTPLVEARSAAEPRDHPSPGRSRA